MSDMDYGNNMDIRTSAPPAAVQAEPKGWLDEKGQFHLSPRHDFLGLVDETCRSAEHIWSGTSLEEAGEAWRINVARGSKDVDLTGWSAGIIANHRLMQWRFGDRAGTFACPICGQETPHEHSAEAVARHRETEQWYQESMEKQWAEAERRIAALAARFPERTPLYALPQPENKT